MLFRSYRIIESNVTPFPACKEFSAEPKHLGLQLCRSVAVRVDFQICDLVLGLMPKRERHWLSSAPKASVETDRADVNANGTLIA